MTVDIAALITVIEKTLKNVRNEQWEYRKLNGEHQVIVKGSLKTGAGWRQYSHITNEVDDIREAKYIAAVNPENINTLITELEAAQARIAELESKQEPVGYFRKMPNGTYHPLSKSTAVMDMIPLYTAPPKPVVALPEPYDDGHGNCWFSKESVENRLKAAGIAVKDGEQ